MGSMVTFTFAFFAMCFGKTTMATRCLVGLVALFCVTLVTWCIWMFQEFGESLDRRKTRLQTFIDNKETIWQRIYIWRRGNIPASVTGGV
jgi:cell division protein FtsW (lipid II flippase)